MQAAVITPATNAASITFRESSPAARNENFDVARELNCRPAFRRRLMLSDGRLDMFEVAQLWKHLGRQEHRTAEQDMQLKIISWIRDKQGSLRDVVTGEIMMRRICNDPSLPQFSCAKPASIGVAVLGKMAETIQQIPEFPRVAQPSQIIRQSVREQEQPPQIRQAVRDQIAKTQIPQTNQDRVLPPQIPQTIQDRVPQIPQPVRVKSALQQNAPEAKALSSAQEPDGKQCEETEAKPIPMRMKATQVLATSPGRPLTEPNRSTAPQKAKNRRPDGVQSTPAGKADPAGPKRVTQAREGRANNNQTNVQAQPSPTAAPTPPRKDDLLTRARENLMARGIENPTPTQVFAECAILSCKK